MCEAKVCCDCGIPLRRRVVYRQRGITSLFAPRKKRCDECQKAKRRAYNATYNAKRRRTHFIFDNQVRHNQ